MLRNLGQALAAEKGYSAHTIRAYGHDLAEFSAYAAGGTSDKKEPQPVPIDAIDSLTGRDVRQVKVTIDSGDSETRQKFRKRLREGTLDDKEIEIDVSVTPVGVEIMAPPGMEEMTSQLQGMFQNLGGSRTTTRKLKVKDALKQMTDEEAAKMLDEEELKKMAERFRARGGGRGERRGGDRPQRQQARLLQLWPDLG